jgi:hypothetical protein
MSLCGFDCGCNTPCDKPVTLEELLDVADEEPDIDGTYELVKDVPVADLIQRVKERRMGL